MHARGLVGLVILLVTGCTAARYDRFEHYATAVLVAVDLGATVCDYGQTVHSGNHGRWDWGLTEANPVLGHRPSLDKITVGLAAGAAGVMVGARVLPRGWRLAFALVVTAAAVHNVATNGGSAKHPRRLCGYR
ncbi:MAG: hypothetical protein KBD62_32190 [Kofleriaceae bacterium]|nr:hypothetical protein [Kofleriaceae bacterium]